MRRCRSAKRLLRHGPTVTMRHKSIIDEHKLDEPAMKQHVRMVYGRAASERLPAVQKRPSGSAQLCHNILIFKGYLRSSIGDSCACHGLAEHGTAGIQVAFMLVRLSMQGSAATTVQLQPAMQGSRAIMAVRRRGRHRRAADKQGPWGGKPTIFGNNL